MRKKSFQCIDCANSLLCFLYIIANKYPFYPYFALMQHLLKAITCLTSILLLQACAATKGRHEKTVTMPGTWQSQPVTVDGDNKEWPSPYPNYDNKGKIAYATSNDGTYLYITMQTGDELTEMKMLKAGMTVSIDTGGKKSASFAINYPLQNDNSELDLPAPDGDKAGAIQFERQLFSRIRKAMETAGQVTFDGFADCSGGFMAGQANQCGIKVKARINEYKELVWEAAIPLKTLYGRELSTAELARPIGICYTVKGLKAPKKAADNSNNNINQSIGGNRNAMMNAMPQGRGSAENPLEHLYTTTKTWKMTTLVAHP